MNIFFENLANSNSKESAFKALKKYLIKRKLDISDESRTYEEIKKEFEELKDLIKKNEILEKLVK